MKQKLFGGWLILCCIWALSAKAVSGDTIYAALPFEANQPTLPVIPELIVSLEDYGGVGDGETLNTKAFDAAISDLSRRGGGHLIVPEGIWVTGPIVMKSNIDLHVVKNAVVLFTSDKIAYPILSPDEGTAISRCQSPISAYHERNFSITGEGVFDGNGEYWRPVKRGKVSDVEWNKLLSRGGTVSKNGKIWYPWGLHGENTPYVESPERLAKVRPRLLRAVACEQVLLQGVVIQNSPSFHVNFIMCKDVTVDGIMVRCPWNAQNGDGIDFSSCADVWVTNVSVDVGDDAICLKSGIGETGRNRGACRNVVISNCTVFHGHGGFVIGSDTGGGIYNVLVRDCRFLNTDAGIRLKSCRGRGGLVENIFVDHVLMNDIAGNAIWFESFYQEGAPVLHEDPEGGEKTDAPYMAVNADTPCFRNIHISDVICQDAEQAMLLNGLPEMNIRDVDICRCFLKARKGMQINETDNLDMDHLILDVEDSCVVSFNNAKHINISHMFARNGNKFYVTGSRNQDIQVKGENINQSGVCTTPMAVGTICIN